jgi:hypothetical protein
LLFRGYFHLTSLEGNKRGANALAAVLIRRKDPL